MLDEDTSRDLHSIAESLRRLADRFAPVEEKSEKRRAVLSKAIYNREEREAERRRQAARIEEQESQRRTP